MTTVFDDVVVPLDVVEEVIGISNLARVAGSVIIIALTGVTAVRDRQHDPDRRVRAAPGDRNHEAGGRHGLVRARSVRGGGRDHRSASGRASRPFALVVLYAAQAAPVVTRIVSFLPVSTDTEFVRNLAVFTLLVGLIVGSLGSYFSVRRYLSV